MKHLLYVPLFLIIAATCASAQVRSEETVTTTDTSGRTTTINVTTLSKTEDITPRNDIILMSPIDFIRFYNLSYLHAIAPNMAIGGGFKLAHDLSEEFDAHISFGIALEGRFYPAKKGVKGFYVAPNTSINWLSSVDYNTGVYDPLTGRTNYPERTTTGMAFSIGLISGWQFFPLDEMAMGVGLGFERNILMTSNSVTNEFQEYDGTTVPTFRFDIGYAW